MLPSELGSLLAGSNGCVKIVFDFRKKLIIKRVSKCTYGSIRHVEDAI